jgi:hypothetical protein
VLDKTVPACDEQKRAQITGGVVTEGSLLFCSLTPGSPLNVLRHGVDIDAWFFADDVRPTTGGHRLLTGVMLQQLKSYGWL